MTTYEWLIGDESSSDTLSTEDSRGFFLWDLHGSTNTLEYSINVDWNGDDDLDGSNEAEYMLRWACDRGRQRLIGSPGSGFEPYRVGRLTVELDNHDGRFNPWNTDSPLYGNLEPGKLMEMKVAIHDSTSATGYTTYSVFTGYTSGLSMNGWNETATLECEDGLGMLENKKFDMFVIGNYTTPTDIKIYDVMDNFVELSGYPYGTDFSTGDPSSDYLGAVAFVDNGTYLNEFEKICNASLGSIACEKDGTLAYHSIYDSDSSILTLTDSNTIRYPEFPNPWEYKRTKVNLDAEILYNTSATIFLADVTHKTYNISALTSEVLWMPYFTSYAPSYLSEETYFDNLHVSEFPSTGYFNEYIYLAESSDLFGVDSSDYSLTITPYLTNAKVEITNPSTSEWGFGYLYYVGGEYACSLSKDDNKFDFERISVGSTSSEWDESEFKVESSVYNTIHYYFGGYGTPVPTSYANAQRARINKLGNLIYDYVSTEHVFPILQMEGRYDYQFLLDVEKKVTYTSALLGISDDYRICGLSHQSLGTPQSVLTTIYLYPVIPSST